MAFKTYKNGLTRKLFEDQGIEFSTTIFGRFRYPFSFKRKGDWKKLPPRKHPGWAAYNARTDK